MISKSMPPASAHLADKPVPAPPPMIGFPAATWLRRRCKHSSRLKMLMVIYPATDLPGEQGEVVRRPPESSWTTGGSLVGAEGADRRRCGAGDDLSAADKGVQGDSKRATPPSTTSQRPERLTPYDPSTS